MQIIKPPDESLKSRRNPDRGSCLYLNSPSRFSVLYVIFVIICTDTASKPSEESFSRDEIMITVAWLTLKIYHVVIQ